MAFSKKLTPKMNDGRVSKDAFERIKYVKYGEFSTAQTVDPTMAPVHVYTRHVHNLTPVSRENKRCKSQHARVTIVELVHRRAFTG